MTDAELIKREKTLTAIGYMIVVFSVIMIFTGSFLVLTKTWKFNPYVVLPIALVFIIFLSGNNLKQIKKEKQARGLN